MDDWHLSLPLESTDIDIIQCIEDSDFKDGESAMKAAQELLGETNPSFFMICRYQMTEEGVVRDDGFTSGEALMTMVPDKMINYSEQLMQKWLDESEGILELDSANLL